MGRYSGKKCRLLSMFGLTAGFFLVEISVGYVTNSMALVADSFHMLSDVAALLVAFLSVKVKYVLHNNSVFHIVYINFVINTYLTPFNNGYSCSTFVFESGDFI